MKTCDIAALTQYTQAYIRRECRLGRLKSIRTMDNNRVTYIIESADYEAWKNNPPCERRAFKTRTTNHYKPRTRRIICPN